jgi:hypothetical protein
MVKIKLADNKRKDNLWSFLTRAEWEINREGNFFTKKDYSLMLRVLERLVKMVKFKLEKAKD